jgi:hypothetical protein
VCSVLHAAASRQLAFFEHAEYHVDRIPERNAHMLTAPLLVCVPYYWAQRMRRRCYRCKAAATIPSDRTRSHLS